MMFHDVVELILSNTIMEIALLCFKIFLAILLFSVTALAGICVIATCIKLGEQWLGKLAIDKRKRVVYDS